MLDYIVGNGLYILCPLVFLAGFLDGSVGGGGLVSVPAYLIAGVPLHTAYGTNKLVNGVGTVFSMIKYIKTKNILWRLIPVAAAAALIGSQFGAKLVVIIDEKYCQWVMVALLPIILAAVVLNKKYFFQIADRKTQKQPNQAVNFLVAFAVGCYDGFFGPGAGTFYLLGFTLFLGIDLVNSAGNTKVVNVVSNFGALAVFIAGGFVKYDIVLPLILCSMTGNYLGASFAIKRGTKYMLPMLAVVIGILFCKVLFDLL
ncbi:MAG: sulfite exporter TauE/SafE family protein [Bacillota bacterium]|jgi:uncharacterized membrane protein YfcA